MCRADMEDFDQENAQPDKELQKKLKQLYPVAWEERHKEYLEEIDDEKHKIIKKLIVGNDCIKAPGRDGEWKQYVRSLAPLTLKVDFVSSL